MRTYRLVFVPQYMAAGCRHTASPASRQALHVMSGAETRRSCKVEGIGRILSYMPTKPCRDTHEHVSKAGDGTGHFRRGCY
ncbi:hypothetical protein LX32DRAFT_636607 [Colletotrichum zoysiae]|uniref:Uncharacterized protein n=1 Tax=Colletotrichum zoysiae TaxID=1216348 RepID=A0AAD9HN86_9PEZI|nr:hypothetical protein LX32DRAFT_636607 [Colletotrichum zoysiae]